MRDINSLNRVLLIGRVGQKPEIRYLPQKERALARFSVATNERLYNPGTRETSDRTEWHRIVAWGKLAEFCEKYLAQGRQILVEGKLRTRSWSDKEGAKRSTTEVEAQNIVLLGRRTEGTEEEPYQPQPQPQPQSAAADFPVEEEEADPARGSGEDEEIPF
jgi:single-strand DNA-binding protein